MADPEARHGPYHEWTWREGGKLRHKIVPPEEVDLLREAIHNYRTVQKLLERWERESAKVIFGAPDRKSPSGKKINEGEMPSGCAESGARLPPGCILLDPPMANLEPEAPVSQWSRGFSAGHMWLEDAWDRYLPEEMEEEMGAALATLAFFASRSMAETMASEFSGADVTVEGLAEMFCRVFPDAAMEYAGIGRVIYEAVMLS